jgi:hypothetical protein
MSSSCVRAARARHAAEQRELFPLPLLRMDQLEESKGMQELDGGGGAQRDGGARDGKAGGGAGDVGASTWWWKRDLVSQTLGVNNLLSCESGSRHPPNRGNKPSRVCALASRQIAPPVYALAFSLPSRAMVASVPA